MTEPIIAAIISGAVAAFLISLLTKTEAWRGTALGIVAILAISIGGFLNFELKWLFQAAILVIATVIFSQVLRISPKKSLAIAIGTIFAAALTIQTLYPGSAI